MFIKMLRFFRLVESCPNCDSAWSGGHSNPQDICWCALCGEGPTGRVWSYWLYSFTPKWIRRFFTNRRFKKDEQLRTRFAVLRNGFFDGYKIADDEPEFETNLEQQIYDDSVDLGYAIRDNNHWMAVQAIKRLSRLMNKN